MSFHYSKRKRKLKIKIKLRTIKENQKKMLVFLLIAEKDAILVVCDRLLKITHFITTIKETLVKGLARLFRNNMWKWHRLLESIVLDRDLQFVVELIKKLNRVLKIKTINSFLFTNKWTN